mmetsp:Transcript_107179/g.345835  ORF Transcript_107179/g.345835 Transcript_107179/m.345835 type:complete len:296 (+) Transcript_107179:118-1005(+)
MSRSWTTRRRCLPACGRGRASRSTCSRGSPRSSSRAACAWPSPPAIAHRSRWLPSRCRECSSPTGGSACSTARAAACSGTITPWPRSCGSLWRPRSPSAGTCRHPPAPRRGWAGRRPRTGPQSRRRSSPASPRRTSWWGVARRPRLRTAPKASGPTPSAAAPGGRVRRRRPWQEAASWAAAWPWPAAWAPRWPAAAASLAARPRSRAGAPAASGAPGRARARACPRPTARWRRSSCCGSLAASRWCPLPPSSTSVPPRRLGAFRLPCSASGTSCSRRRLASLPGARRSRRRRTPW